MGTLLQLNICRPQHHELNSWRCRSLLLPLITAALLMLTSLSAAQNMADGSAIITSRRGSISATTASGQKVQLATHAVLQASGLKFTTNQDSQFFLTFSNGVALAVGEASSVQCHEFIQRPFKRIEQPIDLEPSTSKLQLQLITGQLALASNRLSPLSELRVKLPQGEVRLHKGTCLIQLDATGLHITAYDGNLTYYYPETNEREFISAPKSVRISQQSMERQQVAETNTVDSLAEDKIQFCRAAQHASNRVTFKANDATGLPPVPVLIVSPDYFKQDDIRPYQLKK